MPPETTTVEETARAVATMPNVWQRIFPNASFLTDPLPLINVPLGNIILAIIVLILSWAISRLLLRLFRNRLRKTKLQDLAIDFLDNFLNVLLNIAVLLLTIATIGIPISSIIVGLSAVFGIVLGFGLQDTLTNIASGIWIVVTHAIDKGEFVEVNGLMGTVQGVRMLATELLTPDNKYIIMPNKLIWGAAIVNYSRMPIRRAAIDVGIAYDSDVGKAYAIANQLMKDHELVLDEPESFVFTTELANSSVNLQLRAWCNTADFWTVTRELRNGILEAFRREGVEIPFPQLDVKIKNPK